MTHINVRANNHSPQQDSASTGSTGLNERERARMDIVIVGHVDHGKSTVIGRLLADTGSLPEGKLESIREYCARNARPFEYAFLLDALKDEQAQGITIDTARTFFKSVKRDYVIIDAPGHIEFLKNMVTGAARAEAAVLVIDAKEGIQENSKRHGYLLSMLGIKQIVVAVNKMDLVDYSREAFENIRDEYVAFLARIGATPRFFVPIAAFPGEGMVGPSGKMPWYKGPDLLSAVDAFEKAPGKDDQPFRLPVQDVYKFTAGGDDRRITSGRVESGTLRVGDKVVFYPSLKSSTVKSIEAFNAPTRDAVETGWSTGVTLSSQLYVGRGELMARADETPPQVADRVRANVFWMGRAPLRTGKDYLLKLGSAKVTARLERINYKIDASESGGEDGAGNTADLVERHDVADVVLSLRKSIAFDPTALLEATGRFVIVDDYEIAGGGIVREGLADEARKAAEAERVATTLWAHEAKPGFVVFLTGHDAAMDTAAEALCAHHHPVLGPLRPDAGPQGLEALSETLFHVATAGITVFARLDELDEYDVEMLNARLASVPRRWARTADEAWKTVREFGG